MKTKQEVKQWFWRVLDLKQQEGIKMGKELAQLFSFLEDTIRRDLQNFNILSFTICGGGRRNFNIRPELQNALLACTTSERVGYLEIAVHRLIQRKLQTSIKVLDADFDLEQVRVKLLKGIKLKQSARILLKSMTLDCNHFQIDLSSYLLRVSKKDPSVFILQTMEQQEPATIRFSLEDYSSVREQDLGKMKSLMFQTLVESIFQKEQTPQEIKLLKSKNRRKQSKKTPDFVKQVSFQPEEKALSPKEENLELKTSLIEELVANSAEGNLNEEEIYDYMERREEETKRDALKMASSRFHRSRVEMLLGGEYHLSQLNAYNDFTPEASGSKQTMIYYSRRRNIFRLEMTLKCQKDQVARHLCQAQHQKLWNRCINESQFKWSITSQNSAIIYRKQMTDSEWFKERDFLFLRHLFVSEDSCFIIDRSIEHPYFIPFEAIHRAHIHFSVCRLDRASQGTRLLMDFKVDHGGLLSQSHKNTMVLEYLKEYSNLQGFITKFSGVMLSGYDINWQIDNLEDTQNNQSMASISSQIFMDAIQPMIDQENLDQESFFSIAEEPIEELMIRQVPKGQAPKKKQLPWCEGKEEIRFDIEGLIQLPKEYLSVYHTRDPAVARGKRKEIDYDSIMLKKDFVSDKQGAMVLVNQAKIAAQNNVIKFIMSTLKKNLFSGKGILNISLPVEIFNIDSNLQRLCEGMSLAPDFLQKAAKEIDVERFNNCVAFAMSNSILYFDIDKPFNPILGETFQGSIDGCPVYAEQISHHPPITSVLLVGRGYRVYGNLEAKVYVHLNSGEGVNEGLYTIEFQDGEKIFFQTAPGEVSGLAVGDRKYRIKGKMLVISPKSKLCSVVSFEDESGIFSSKKWIFCDQIEGSIARITDSFVRSFFTKERGKDVVCPNKKEVTQTLGTVAGRWTQKMLINDVLYYDINTVPYQLAHYKFPLSSNSDYRQDLAYRKMDNLARSQQEKERLEIVQRNDRKLREKYNPKHS